MYPYPIAANEHQRIAALDELRIIDTQPQPFFDSIVLLASNYFGCPIAAISFIGEDRQWFKARVGLDVCETERDVAFCNYTILASEIFVVEDASLDDRFRENPFVTGPPFIRFYAGYPLSLDRENRLGSLCIVDDKPRIFTDQDRLFLTELGHVVEALLRSHAQALELDAAVEKSKRETSELEVKNSLLVQAERITGIGTWALDVDTGHVTWSDEVFRLHDLPVEEPPTLDVGLGFYREPERALVERHMKGCIDTGLPFDFELDMVSATGRTRRIRSCAEAVVKDGRTSRLVGILQDVTFERNAQEALWHLANIDAITGIANRNRFQTELAERFLDAASTGSPVSLMLLDLDGFKEINDTRGHQAGDEVLKSVARRLERRAPDGATVARLGGDEFAIIVPGLRTASAQRSLALQFQATLKKPVLALGEKITVSATMGIANYPRDALTSEGLLRCADIALYNGKNDERGTVGLYTVDVINLFDKRRVSIEKVGRAVIDNRLMPFYQPFVRLSDGAIYGYEALARIRNEDGTVSTAGDFAEAFTDPRSCRRIGDRMVELVTADIANLVARGVNPGIVSLNASQADLRDAGFPDRLLQRLEECRLDPVSIKLEVTETLFLGDDQKVIKATLQQLSNAGILIALDDFGTGFSSLTHLRDFPIHQIKIDKSFVFGLGKNAESPAIIKALVDLAHTLGMTVIAEGVETVGQYDFLRSIGCDSGQGYLLEKQSRLLGWQAGSRSAMLEISVQLIIHIVAIRSTYGSAVC